MTSPEQPISVPQHIIDNRSLYDLSAIPELAKTPDEKLLDEANRVLSTTGVNVKVGDETVQISQYAAPLDDGTFARIAYRPSDVDPAIDPNARPERLRILTMDTMVMRPVLDRITFESSTALSFINTANGIRLMANVGTEPVFGDSNLDFVQQILGKISEQGESPKADTAATDEVAQIDQQISHPEVKKLISNRAYELAGAIGAAASAVCLGILVQQLWVEATSPSKPEASWPDSITPMSDDGKDRFILLERGGMEWDGVLDPGVYKTEGNADPSKGSCVWRIEGNNGMTLAIGSTDSPREIPIHIDEGIPVLELNNCKPLSLVSIDPPQPQKTA